MKVLFWLTQCSQGSRNRNKNDFWGGVGGIRRDKRRCKNIKWLRKWVDGNIFRSQPYLSQNFASADSTSNRSKIFENKLLCCCWRFCVVRPTVVASVLNIEHKVKTSIIFSVAIFYIIEQAELLTRLPGE